MKPKVALMVQVYLVGLVVISVSDWGSTMRLCETRPEKLKYEAKRLRAV